VFRVILSPAGQFAVLGASLAFTVAIVGLGAVRYRGTHNPSALFVTWGFAVLAANTLLVMIWSFAHPAARGPFPFPVYTNDFATDVVRAGRQAFAWWVIGWIGAGMGLLILRPWWDRRGRKPVDSRAVAVVAIAATAALDLLAALATKTAQSTTRVVFSVRTASPVVIGWITALVAIVVLVAATARLVRRPPSQLLAGLGAGFAATSIGLQLQHVTIGTDLFRRADLASVVALALVFGAMLVDERTDHTRMRRATDRAQAVMGGRAEIASMLGHEVKGPVATIRGLAGTTIAHYDRLSDTERQEFISLIEQESRKLLTTVDQASLGMKVDARTLSFVQHPTELAVVVRDVVDGFDAGEHQLTFEAPEPAATATVDRKWLAEAVRQVLLNAAAFSPPRSPIRIVVRQMDPNTAAVDVIDAGPGIPRDQWETVFQKFAPWRPEGYEEAAGTGLGLFIARGIVRAHGGDIRFADRPSGGTMLSIQLPTGRPMEGTV
jgi:signal transduction histidine kinase